MELRALLSFHECCEYRIERRLFQAGGLAGRLGIFGRNARIIIHGQILFLELGFVGCLALKESAQLQVEYVRETLPQRRDTSFLTLYYELGSPPSADELRIQVSFLRFMNQWLEDVQ